MLDLDFVMSKSKIITSVGLRLIDKNGKESKRPLPYDTVFDTGCTMTTMSVSLFNDLGYSYKNEAKITIIGVNGENEGKSTVIDYFEVGGKDIGPVRIAVGRLHDNHKDRIILGMNIIMWHHFSLDHMKKRITLVERQLKNFDHGERYIIKDITTLNLSNIIVHEN